MIGFFIKKNFFDGWENLSSIIVSNLLTLPFVAFIFFTFWIGGPIIIFNGVGSVVLLQAASLFFGVALIIVFSSAYAKNAISIINSEGTKCSDYFKNLGWAFKENLGFGFLVSFIVTSLAVGVPFYIYLNSFYGVMIASFLLCFALIVLLALQWYIPLKVLLGFKFKKTILKCFDILFDNFAFSLFMALYSTVLFACSVVLLFFMPGFSGIVLGYVNALKLRLYKYDWLEQHKNLKGAKDRKNIPWDALLKEDRDAMSKKSLKRLFTPWRSDIED